MHSDSDDEKPVYRSVGLLFFAPAAHKEAAEKRTMPPPCMLPPPPTRQNSSEATGLPPFCGVLADSNADSNPHPGPWWGTRRAGESTLPTPPSHDDHADVLGPGPAGPEQFAFHIGSDGPMLPRRAASSPPPSVTRRSPGASREEARARKGAGDDDELDGLSLQWARLKLEADELRTNLATSVRTMEELAASNESILQELRSSDPPSASAGADLPCGESSALAAHATGGPELIADETTIVVMSGDEEDEEDEEDEGGDADDDEDGAELGSFAATLSDDEDDDGPVYRGHEMPSRDISCNSSTYTASPSPSPPKGPRGGPPSFPKAKAANMALAPGKRNRSFTSQLAAEPLHPAKQRSQPTSQRTTSPLLDEGAAERARIHELKQLIQTERRELERLIDAYRENEVVIARLKEMNALLIAEITAVRKARELHEAAQGGGVQSVGTR